MNTHVISIYEWYQRSKPGMEIIVFCNCSPMIIDVFRNLSFIQYRIIDRNNVIILQYDKDVVSGPNTMYNTILAYINNNELTYDLIAFAYQFRNDYVEQNFDQSNEYVCNFNDDNGVIYYDILYRNHIVNIYIYIEDIINGYAKDGLEILIDGKNQIIPEIIFGINDIYCKQLFYNLAVNLVKQKITLQQNAGSTAIDDALIDIEAAFEKNLNLF